MWTAVALDKVRSIKLLYIKFSGSNHILQLQQIVFHSSEADGQAQCGKIEDIAELV